MFEHPLFQLEHRSLERPARSAPGARDRRQAVVFETPDWVNVVAVDERDDLGPRLVMVRQWRFGVSSSTIEIPGGIVDPGESPLEAAARELFEETGHRADSWTRLGEVAPNPALFSNRCVTFLAERLRRVGEPTGDGEEEIEVVSVPISELARLVAAGEIRHALVIAAFHLYELHRRRGSDSEGQPQPGKRGAQIDGIRSR